MALRKLTCRTVPLKLCINVPRSLLVAVWRGLPLINFLRCAVIRVLMESLTPRQTQFVMPSTGEVYEKWITMKQIHARTHHDAVLASRLVYDIEALPDGASWLMWIGDRTRAKKTVLFLHGGGYLLPLDPGQLEWCLQAYVRAGQDIGVEVAVAVLHYTLCPEGQYPVQLCQAADALGHILDSGTEPRDIIIGGDSCGGNLTVALLCHILHPHPAARRIEVSQPLAAAFTVSPWLSKRETGRAFDENRHLDMVSSKIVHQSFTLTLRGSRHVAEEREGKGWAMPIDVDDAWFIGMSNVVGQLYVTVGKNEVLRDEGIQLAESMLKRNPDMEIRLEVREKEAHDFILLEGQICHMGNAMKAMKAWMLGVLSKSTSKT